MTPPLPTVAPPEAGGGWREIELAEAPGKRTRTASRAGSPLPPPTSSPTREARTHGGARCDRLGRHHRVSGSPFRYGLSVAEAMDTAQRNIGLDWPATQQVITRSAGLAREHGARIASGVGTDQLSGPASNLDEVTRAYLPQVEAVEGQARR